MSRIIRLIILFSVALLAVCCHAPEPKVDLQAEENKADVEAIKALYDLYVATIAEGDYEGYIALWAEDIIMMPPDRAIVEGKEAARPWVQSLFDQFRMKEAFSFDEIEVAGNWAFARGTYEFEATPKTEGEAIQESGNIIYILKRQTDGSWKITSGIWNNPPAGTQ